MGINFILGMKYHLPPPPVPPPSTSFHNKTVNNFKTAITHGSMCVEVCAAAKVIP